MVCFIILFQFLFRQLNFFFKKSNINVFFDYYNHYSHPDIKKRYNIKNAPLHWVNLKACNVVHCLQFAKPEYLGKKIIIEPSDNVLVIGCSLGLIKPSDQLLHCEEIDNFISSKISRVLIGPNELINHARYYFSNEALKKFFIFPEFACELKVNESYLKYKNKNLNLNRKIKFLSIASNFDNKAVDLLIEAFLESKCSGELILVCDGLPDNLEKKVLKTDNISLIKDLYLSNTKKDKLYKSADVYINTTYIDGAFVAPKALEYGLPIITHTYHRGRSFVANANGILLEEPMKYYDPEAYGVRWDSFGGYLEQVNLLKKKRRL